MPRTAPTSVFAAAALLASLALSASGFAADAPPVATPAPAPAPASADKPAEKPADAPTTEAKELGVADSILRMVVRIEAPDIAHPWQLGDPVTALASGVCVKAGDKTYVLVSGARTTYATRIEAADGTLLKVAFSSPGAQLALLTPKDDAAAAGFFRKHPPLELVEFPSVAGLIGFGAAGTTPVEADGTVNGSQLMGGDIRHVMTVEAKNYPAQVEFGPAIDLGTKKLAGLFAGAQLSEDKKAVFASLVSAAEIKTLLDDVKDGRCEGKWAFRNAKAHYRTLVNPALRAKLGLKPETEGLLVAGEAAEIAPLQPGDILTKIGSVAVNNEGMAQIGGSKGFMGSAFYHVNAQAKADTKTLPVTVLRDGKSVELQVPVMRRGDELLPSLVDKGAMPRYFVYGPLCFEQATAEVAQALAQRRGLDLLLSGNPIGAHLTDNLRTKPGEEIVVLSNLFPHDLTKGYSAPLFPAVKSVNGKEVTGLRQLAQLLAACKDDYIEIAFHDKNAETMVFKRDEVLAAARDIQKQNRIVDLQSEDLKDIFKDAAK